MIPETIQPQLDLLCEEYVLVQAWKKTANYIRYHNWFSDTLAIDYAAVNLPWFLAEIRERLQSSEIWENDPLRIVPAPKSQQWIHTISGDWKPKAKGTNATPVRPLAHVSLADQVVATAFMLCLADRVETLQGDSRSKITCEQSRKKIVSYGNRLFCDSIDGSLRHRWGAAKLYRAYFQDYRKFLERPEVVAEELVNVGEFNVFVVHADLLQFYDRVRPELLDKMLNKLFRDGDDQDFFNFGKSLLNWTWHSKDKTEVNKYSQQAELHDFSRVALPQGLVASGFFANIVLLSFDDNLRQAIGTKIMPGIVLADVCRYVDDLTITVAVSQKHSVPPETIKTLIECWLGQLLKKNASDLQLSPSKTRVTAVGVNERPLVPQRSRMNRIQAAVSEGFDALGGKEILDAIQGLVRAQRDLSVTEESGWRFSPMPDVRDETVARFAAGRFRTTFRSVRPLLESESETATADSVSEIILPADQKPAVYTQRELDMDARAFSLKLIQQWIENPSNVRLLRIGLDIYPNAKILKEILILFRPYTVKGSRRRKEQRRVVWYCLSEILRAGAVETGLVADGECLPSDIDLRSYRKLLLQEAVRLLELPAKSIPWYLRQQALLFVATFEPESTRFEQVGTGLEIRHYWRLIQYLRGEENRLNSAEFASLAVLARRSFLNQRKAIKLIRPKLNPLRKRAIAERDLSFLIELIDSETSKSSFDDLPARIREDLCYVRDRLSGDFKTLSQIVLDGHQDGLLRNELSLLRFGRAFLEEWQKQKIPPSLLTPTNVYLKLAEHKDVTDVEEVNFITSRTKSTGSLYQPPSWCVDSEIWRFQLGFLLRFVLSRNQDFTRSVRPSHWKENESAYRPSESHRYQRLYGFFNGQMAFGDDWLPASDWIERLLIALLRWPGCRISDDFNWIDLGIVKVIEKFSNRISKLQTYFGKSTGTLLLPMVIKRPTAEVDTRPLRACVVQTVVPTPKDFSKSDLTLDKIGIRKKHRNHLSSALVAVKKMLALRKTHTNTEGQLDWLILPELAVHPNDVCTHLYPFARAYKTMILVGLTFDRMLVGQPLVNSALWIIPEWSGAYGLQIKTLRQGKAHLSRDEQKLNQSSTLIRGFRPCQWLVGYPWSSKSDKRPVWLTASVCYDATDLRLAADLRDWSDVFAIPALSKDVRTFDQMAQALHYHMFQLVVVVNNGRYGGSNAYWPKKKVYDRQIFHMHGQPQASIAFFEIDDIGAYLNQRENATIGNKKWKYPPAGLKAIPLRHSP